MSETMQERTPIPGIKIVAHPEPSAQQEQSGHRSPDEDWKMNVAAVKRFSQAGQWDETLKILMILSSKHKNKEIYKALAQRVWIALKSTAPSADVVLALFHLLNTLGPKHQIAGPIAALAHLMAKHRTKEHADSALAMGQAQQMFALVCDQAGVVGEGAFAIWVKATHLDDPNYYIPVVMNGLEMMVGDREEDWWFDRAQLQREMEAAIADKDANNPSLTA